MITQKTKDRVTRTLIKPEVNSGASEERAVLTPHAKPVVLLLLQIR